MCSVFLSFVCGSASLSLDTMSKDSKSAAAAAAAAPKANLSKAEAEAKAAAEKEEQAAAKAADKAKREELEAAVAKFEPAKFDEIARFMQKHKYFERSVRLAPLHVLISRPNNVFSSVRQYFSGKVLRKIIASKEFKEKFRLEFTRPQADILLLAMQNTAAKKPDLKKNLQRRYFIQVEAAPGDTKVNLRPCQISTNEIKPSEPYVWVFQGSLLWRHVLLGTVITIFLLLCLYPVWPDFMKLGVWYLSVTLLLFLFTFFLARGVIFLVLWIAGFNFWILPNILDDDVRYFCRVDRSRLLVAARVLGGSQTLRSLARRARLLCQQ